VGVFGLFGLDPIQPSTTCFCDGGISVAPDIFTHTLASFGCLRLQQQKYLEAEATLRDALTAYEKARPEIWERYNSEGMAQREATMADAERSNVTEAGQRIVKLYQAWGKAETAVEWQTGNRGLNRERVGRPECCVGPKEIACHSAREYA
jgi:hypothetical protein